MAEYYHWVPVFSTNSLRAWTEQWVYEQPGKLPMVCIKLCYGKWLMSAFWAVSSCQVNERELEGVSTREGAQKEALAIVNLMAANC
jgi:hypothetical protein